MPETKRRQTASDKLEAEVRQQMTKRFASFKITERLRNGIYRSWYCAAPDQWDCSFTITTIPGRLIMTGDLGALIVERTYDMLPWCRGSCDSTEYFAENTPREIPTTEFSRDVLEEWIREELSDIRQRRIDGDLNNDDESNEDILIDVLQWDMTGNGEGYFARALEDVWQGNDYPQWHIWKRQFLVQREAVRWFVMNNNDDPIPEPKKI